MTTMTKLPTKIKPALYVELGATFDGDPYGWATSWASAIADALHDRDDVPEHWHYSPGINPPRVVHMAANVDGDFTFEQEMVSTMLIGREVTVPDLLYAGDVLMRYIKLVTILGHSY